VANILNQALSEGRLSIGELDERLQQVYASKTLGELVPLTADLPVATPIGSTPMPLAQQGYQVDNRIGGAPGGSVAFAVMGGFQRKGNWVVPGHYTAFAMMGGGEIDLTEAHFAEAETTIQCFAFMGGIEIIVPDDITVQVNGFAFMGGFDHRHAQDGPPGSPVVHVTGFAMMGGVDVKRRKPRRGRIGRRDRDQLGR
jgi:hypothetical protein